MKLPKKQAQQIAIFREELLKVNQKLNLFSRKNPEQQVNLLFDQGFLTGGFLESVFNRATGPILDIGSGNGFPGLLMGVLYPKTFFHLCERNRKKAEFLKYVSAKAEISNVKVFCKEAEELKKQFSIILSQAALPEKKMLKLLIKLLALSGEAFLWKSSCWEKSWPKNKNFIPEVFQSYEIGASKKILLRVRKKDISV